VRLIGCLLLAVRGQRDDALLPISHSDIWSCRGDEDEIARDARQFEMEGNVGAGEAVSVADCLAIGL